MERIGIYGGTFNPPHIGHIQAAQQALHHLKLDRILLIPDRIAPHKEIPSGSPTPQQRMDMLHLAVKNCPGLEVSDIELKREGVSYTYLTVEELKAQYVFTGENAMDIILAETGKVFAGVLEDAGVYKYTAEGKAAFLKFVEAVNAI